MGKCFCNGDPKYMVCSFAFLCKRNNVTAAVTKMKMMTNFKKTEEVKQWLFMCLQLESFDFTITVISISQY